MYRQIYPLLDSWKQSKTRKPLILKGVRQCGKTYCLKTFGRKSFRKTHYLNFEKNDEIHQLFETNLDPAKIIEELSFYLDTDINIDSDFIIFDEAQACPKALTSLKYFCEDMPQLALAAAGSLLGLQLTSGAFPVGKIDLLNLRPLSFIEFLHAVEEKNLANLLENFSHEQSIPTMAHAKLWEKLKWYFITGGLPEVVDLFRHETDRYIGFKKAREKQNELIYAYYADIAKHAGKVNALHIERIWNASPIQLAKTQNGNARRFQFKDVVPGIDRYSRLANAIDWLTTAELIIKVPIVNQIEIPLKAYTEDSKFNLFVFDVGILGAMVELTPKAILDYDYGTYKGYFAENFIAQNLPIYNHEKLYSWQHKRAEVEFIIQKEADIIPIEVKSGWITKAKSLQSYAEKYHPPYKIIMSAKEAYIDTKTHTHYLPLYLVNYI